MCVCVAGVPLLPLSQLLGCWSASTPAVHLLINSVVYKPQLFILSLPTCCFSKCGRAWDYYTVLSGLRILCIQSFDSCVVFWSLNESLCHRILTCLSVFLLISLPANQSSSHAHNPAFMSILNLSLCPMFGFPLLMLTDILTFLSDWPCIEVYRHLEYSQNRNLWCRQRKWGILLPQDQWLKIMLPFIALLEC